MRFSLESIARSRPWVILAVGGGALGLGLVAAAYAGPITGPFEVDDGTDSFAIKGYTYTAANATGVLGYGGNSSATNATGVAGYVTSPLSVGVTGYAASTGVNAYGVYGFSNTGNGVYGVSNNADTASVYGYAPGGGTGLYGYSVSGTGTLGISGQNYGVIGVTSTNNTSSSTFEAGVLAEDGSTAGYYNVGVAGTTLRGFAVYGLAGGADGYGGYFTSNLLGGATAALAIDNKEAGLFVGRSGGASYPALVAETGTAGTDPFATANASGQETFIVQSTTQAPAGDVPAFANDVQISGNLYVEGEILGGCYTYPFQTAFPVTNGPGCAFGGPDVGKEQTASGTEVRAYSARQSLPTTEDFGEAELVNGQANVPLDRTFASTIDPSRSYLVFITPEGDSRGLYVTGKSLNGFAVHESMNGHSTLPFQYRIVAHPYRDTSARFPAVPAAKSQAVVARSAGMLGPDPKARALRAGAGIPEMGTIPKRLPQPPANPNFMRLAPHVK